MAFTVTRIGGDRLQKLARMYQRQVTVQAGFFEDAADPDTGEKMAACAAAIEYGAPGMPARPFMRPAVQEHMKDWVQTVGEALSLGKTPQQAMESAGARMVEDIRAAVRNIRLSGNSEHIGRGRHGQTDKGLRIRKETMLNAVRYRVEG